MTTAPARTPSTLGLALHGAALGVWSGAWLASWQAAAAWRADLLWLVDDPLRMAASCVALGGVAGFVGAFLLALVARLLPSLDRAVFVFAGLALAPAALRALASAALRGRDVAGGRTTALLVTAGVWLVLSVLVMHVLGRRRAAGLRLAPSAWAVSAAALLCVQWTHLDLLAGREAARLAGRVGWVVLAWLAAAGAAGVGLGLLLGAPRVLRRVGAAAALVVLAGVGLQRHHPPVAHAATRAADGPNVLLVVLDTLRRDAVSAYGAAQDTTPRLDALAAKGVRWSDALAPGNWTIPSHASLFTGAQVTRHGAGHARRHLRLQPGGAESPVLPTQAELLAWRGYRTAAFVCNMNVSAANGFARGFHEFHEVWRGLQGDYDVLAPAARSWLGLGVHDKGGASAARGLTQWLQRHADDARPWFLFVNMMEPHAPYDHVPAEHTARFVADAPDAALQALLDDPLAHTWQAGVSAEQAAALHGHYLAAVSYQDELLGRVLDALEASGAGDDTLVVVTSDHGEHFGTFGLLGHGQDLGDELLAVPLVAAGPGLPRGVVDDTPVSLLDVLPSLQAWTGGDDLPPDAGRTGRVLRPGAEPADAARRARLAERYAHFREDVVEYDAATGGDATWAHERARRDGPAGSVEVVYGEDEAAVWAGDPTRREALDAARARWLRAVDVAERVEWDAAMREQLRALGYVGS